MPCKEEVGVMVLTGVVREGPLVRIDRAIQEEARHLDS